MVSSNPKTRTIDNNNTNVEGVFVAGCGSAPMNLTDTLADARSAAMNIIEYVKLKKIL